MGDRLIPSGDTGGPLIDQTLSSDTGSPFGNQTSSSNGAVLLVIIKYQAVTQVVLLPIIRHQTVTQADLLVIRHRAATWAVL